MRKIIILVVLAAAVLYFVPGVRQRIFGGVNSTVGEWTTPDAGPVKELDVIRVHALRNGVYYHLKDCPEIAGRDTVVMTLPKARALYKPCPVCNPPR